MLVAAREAGVRRVLYAASAAAYGDDPTLPKREDMAPQPLSPYAAAKLTGEHYCAAFTHGYGLETVVLRYFNVYGPRQDPRSPYAGVISRFMAALLRGEAPTIYGDGSQSRDFVYVADVVAANLLALAAPAATGTPINVASGQRHSLLDLVATLNTVLGTAIAPCHEPRRVGDVWHSQASIARAAEVLGYRPQTSLLDGLGGRAPGIGRSRPPRFVDALPVAGLYSRGARGPGEQAWGALSDREHDAPPQCSDHAPGPCVTPGTAPRVPAQDSPAVRRIACRRRRLALR